MVPSCAWPTLWALQSDAELERLTGGPATGARSTAPARRLAAASGAQDAATAVGAVEALRGVLWESLLGELREPTRARAGRRGRQAPPTCARASSP